MKIEEYNPCPNIAGKLIDHIVLTILIFWNNKYLGIITDEIGKTYVNSNNPKIIFFPLNLKFANP